MRPVPALYKYMKCSRFVEMLRAPSIRFTQPDFLNDPYECHLTLDAELLKANYRKYLESHAEKLTYDELNRRVNAAEETLIVDALVDYRKKRRSLGVLSLSEDPLQLLMWAHYGEEHRGVVVEFDLTHPNLRPGSDGENTYSGLEKVTYSSKKITGIPNPDTIIDVLSRKSPEWKYEREWRLIRTLNLTREVSENINVVDFDLSAVKGVYLGARFSAELLEEITGLMGANNGSHIKVLKVDIAPHRFELKTTDASRYGWKLLHRKYYFGEMADEALATLPMQSDF